MDPMMILIQAAKKDPHYQWLLRQCREMEADYSRIMDSLCPQDRERMEQYISICENMEYCKVCLAIEMWGPKNPAVP